MTTVGLPLKPSPAVVELPARVQRISLKSSFVARMTDTGFRYAMWACSFSVMVIVALLLWELVNRSKLSIAQFGFKFFTGSQWDPVAGQFGALPFIYDL
jgi:phosphate transport system permease protein